MRDRAVLGLLLGCALRRAERIRLCVEHIQQRARRWVLPDVVGKGKRVRTIPLPAWVKLLIEDWMTVSRIQEGPPFRAVNNLIYAQAGLAR